MILSKLDYLFRPAILGLIICASLLFLPLRVDARLPSTQFSAQRLLKIRLPQKVDLKLSIFGKHIRRYHGEVELFTGAFSLAANAPDQGTLKISKASPKVDAIHIQLLWIALGSQDVFGALEGLFGKLSKGGKVSVEDGKMVYRYGSSPEISVFRNSADLSGIRLFAGKVPWALKLNRLKNGFEGAVYRDGLIVSRFTIMTRVEGM